MAIKKKTLKKVERVADVLDSAVKEEVVQDEKEVAKEAVTPKGKAIQVLDGARIIRTYCEADHGKDYKALAQQFADKKVYTLK